MGMEHAMTKEYNYKNVSLLQIPSSYYIIVLGICDNDTFLDLLNSSLLEVAYIYTVCSCTIYVLVYYYIARYLYISCVASYSQS